MPPEDHVRLRHMLDAAHTAARFARDHQRTDLDADDLAAHGLVRLIEIIGEAAARVSPSTRTAIPTLPWPAIVAPQRRHFGWYRSSVW
jgi:uncharacterized protein with HEPN domain